MNAVPGETGPGLVFRLQRRNPGLTARNGSGKWGDQPVTLRLRDVHSVGCCYYTMASVLIEKMELRPGIAPGLIDNGFADRGVHLLARAAWCVRKEFRLQPAG